MRLTTKCRYGTRAMIELGKAYGKGPLHLSHIAEQQKISAKYLVHLLASLNAAGLVRTVRGPRGGYLLNRPPSKIKLIEMYRVLEGTTSPVACVDDPTLCQESKGCAARDVWARIGDAIRDVLESTTLQDLID
jgi:Rrf2 family protein